MYPVLGREVMEFQQNITIFRQALNSFCISGFEGRRKYIKWPYWFAFASRASNLYVLQHGFGLGLNGLGHFVEYIGCLVHPAALVLGRRVDLSQSRPKAQCSIAGRRLGGEIFRLCF